MKLVMSDASATIERQNPKVRRWALAATVALALAAAGAGAAPQAVDSKKDEPKMDGKSEIAAEETCGQEMAASAEVPAQWQALMSHVAGNMEWHARWVGAHRSAEARKEGAAMARVAREYRAMAAAAGRAAEAMRAMKDLPAAPHDGAKVDRAAQATWMRTKIKMQRQFAATLLQHAADSEKALAELEASPPQ